MPLKYFAGIPEASPSGGIRHSQLALSRTAHRGTGGNAVGPDRSGIGGRRWRHDPGDPAFAESPGPSRFFDLERTAFGDPARRESTRAKQTGRRQLHHDVHSHATGDSIYV